MEILSTKMFRNLTSVKTMVKTNPNMIGEQYIRNGDGVLTGIDEDKKIAWKSYHEKLLNTEYAWDGISLSQVDIVSSAPQLIAKVMVG